MDYNLIEYFDDFIQKRASDVCLDMANNNFKYKDLKEKYSEIEGVLLNGFNDNTRLLFAEYENIVNSEIGFIREFVYKKGFIDGIKVASIVDKLKIKEMDEL